MELPAGGMNPGNLTGGGAPRIELVGGCGEKDVWTNSETVKNAIPVTLRPAFSGHYKQVAALVQDHNKEVAVLNSDQCRGVCV